MSEFLVMFKDAEVWRLLVAAVVIPYLLAGEQFGLIRLLEWIKVQAHLKDKKILGYPVMRLVAILASILAAGAVSFAESLIPGNLATPAVFVGAVVSFITLSQAWYKKIEPVQSEVVMVHNHATPGQLFADQAERVIKRLHG